MTVIVATGGTPLTEDELVSAMLCLPSAERRGGGLILQHAPDLVAQATALCEAGFGSSTHGLFTAVADPEMDLGRWAVLPSPAKLKRLGRRAR